MDPLAIGATLQELHAAWMQDSQGWSAYWQSMGKDILSAGRLAAEQMRRTADQMPHGKSGDGAEIMLNWVRHLASCSRQCHQMTEKWLTDYILGAPGLSVETRQRAMFWTHQALQMMAPANYFWSNPRAVRYYLNSNSRSLLQGTLNWIDDLQSDSRLPALSDRNAFKVGVNLATTPGRVVYRNSLMELIQYAPQTETTWHVPIVLIQPWINKYYVFDLTPQNSLIRYLVRQGFTVFVTSWKNPTPEMAHVTFENYMLQGALRAVTVARAITGSRSVHAAGYCIGGTLLATLMAWLAHSPGPSPIVDATFFATLLDFSAPGDLKVFAHPKTLRMVEHIVAADGVLKDHYMALAFRLLNPDDLLWRNVINNYLCGATPPRSDLLFWNSDSTHLPGDMCLFYLKSFYLENRLVVPNRLFAADRPIDLKRVRQPIYAVGAMKDHICPWPATFQTCRLTASGSVRYVLANEGHITGIVNPPSRWSRNQYWAGAATRRRDGRLWLGNRAPVSGSWWPDWVAWLKPRSGARKAPPSMGSKRYKPLAPAPGHYVLE